MTSPEELRATANEVRKWDQVLTQAEDKQTVEDLAQALETAADRKEGPC